MKLKALKVAARGVLEYMKISYNLVS